MLDQVRPDAMRFVAEPGAMTREPAIITASYWSAPPGYQLIRTSQGTPDGTEQLPVLHAAIPTWQVRHLAADRAMFEGCEYADTDWQTLYWDLLCDRAEQLIAELDRLVAEMLVHHHLGLALACFERNPADCHRSVLADWLRSHGVDVAVVR